MAIIYAITNKVNNKKYIGQTIQDIRTRWSGHKSKSSGCTKLNRAIQKYGVENFTIEILIECPTDELDSFEIKYIKEYDSIKNGYNIKAGGSGDVHLAWDEERKKRLALQQKGRLHNPAQPSGRISVDQYTLDWEFIANHKSLEEASKAANVGPVTISRACKKDTWSAGGFRWKLSENQPEAASKRVIVNKPTKPAGFKGKKHTEATKLALRQKSKSLGRQVDQFTLDGELVKRHSCLREAADAVNVNTTGVESVCNGICRHSKGFFWKWVAPCDSEESNSESGMSCDSLCQVTSC